MPVASARFKLEKNLAKFVDVVQRRIPTKHHYVEHGQPFSQKETMENSVFAAIESVNDLGRPAGVCTDR